MAEDEVNFKVIVIGGSAGSLEVILPIIAALPAEPNAAIIIIVHRSNDHESVLENLFAYKTPLKVREVEDKDPIRNNCVYIAPGDYHLLAENKQLFALDRSERIHYSRPSIDVAFESISSIFGKRVTGILLSGANADGASGLHRIKNRGGISIVQNPKTAQVPFMPQQAIEMAAPDYILDAEFIPGKLLEILAASNK